ncbi:MAG: thiamine-phosphate kinase [bacterium]
MYSSSFGEFELIKRLLSHFPKPNKNLLVPPGDDCAAIKIYPDKTLLVTTDILIENIHFTQASISPRQLGRKAMAVNLSDIAAMGGVPLYAFLSMGLNKRTEITAFDELIAGMSEMCHRFGVSMSGGDMSASPGIAIVNICIIGEALNNKFLLRSTAQPGDLIQLSGPVGGSAACLNLIMENKPYKHFSTLAKAHFEPEPRIDVGQALNKLPSVHSMIDISDGLAQDIGHICAMSGTGAEIYLENIPLFHEAEILVEGNYEQSFIWALTGGEDYELCWTVQPDAEKLALKTAHDAGAPKPATIGRITDSPGIRITLNGLEWKNRMNGWDHFKDEVH